MLLDKIILPLYLELYEIYPISLDGVKVLFITPIEILTNVKALKKHLEKLETPSLYFVALFLNDISESRKKVFLKIIFHLLLKITKYIYHLWLYICKKKQKQKLNQY
jgi:hypothetical protein